MLKVLSTNKLATSPAYAKILSAYNNELKLKGKVNNKKFWQEIIIPEIPDYSLISWYKFLEKFKTNYGLQETEVRPEGRQKDQGKEGYVKEREVETGLAKTLLSNQAATSKLIQGLLNISAEAAEEILQQAHLLSAKDRLDLGLKAMKAQDSRIQAGAKIREDNRAQEKFDRTFDSATYGGE